MNSERYCVISDLNIHNVHSIDKNKGAKMLQNSQLRKDIATLYEIKKRLAKTAEPDGETPTKLETEALKAEAILKQAIKALEAMDDIVSDD
jgi:hypothetical protein